MTREEHEAQRKLVIASLLHAAARDDHKIRNDYSQQDREYRRMWKIA